MQTFPTTRLRRLRQAPFIRRLVAESLVTVDDLIYPMFITSGDGEPMAIPSLPGLFVYPLPALLKELEQIVQLKIPAIALFPRIPLEEKTADGRAAYAEDGLIPTAIRAIKKAFPDLGVIADVALDPFTSHGQDGLINEAGHILNDETLLVLAKQALCYTRAGADIVAPSDMMDGRVAAIRAMLEQQGFAHTPILAYSAKYASSFYGPFRDAVGSAALLGKSNKATYQMNPANTNEALREVALDLSEGADMILVKPGLCYLDIVQRVSQTFQVPTFAYQVSGEYALLKLGAAHGILDERAAVMESLLAFKRAGAQGVFTYYAKTVAQWLHAE